MNKILLPFLILLTIIFNNCSEKNSEQINIDGSNLKSLVESAIKGSIAANQRLSGLVQSNNLPGSNYNNIKIDSVFSGSKKFFSILVEYPNPGLNIFAIYNNTLKFYLLDNSLNGNLSEETKIETGKSMFIVSEKYLSKDLLKTERTSIYSFYADKWYLTFRFFNRFEIDNKVYTQIIKRFSEEMISTEIRSPDSSLPAGDVFYFDNDTRKYISSKNIFANFVIDQVENFNWVPVQPELESSLKKKQLVNFSDSDFSIIVPEQWKKVVGIELKSSNVKNLTGNMYVHPTLGASISIAKIDFTHSAEDYCDFSFNIERSGNYIIRDSGIIQKNISVVRIIEHTCNQNKFLIILECSKNSYQNNEREINNIIDSFSVKC